MFKFLILVFVLITACFSFALLGSEKSECGLKFNDVNSRIIDCNQFPNSKKISSSGVTWNLVSREINSDDGNTIEVWRDNASNLIWSNILKNEYTHFSAIRLGKNCFKVSDYEYNCNVLVESACESSDGMRASANITDKKFGIPTVSEYEKAIADGLAEVMPNVEFHWFWTSSLNPYPQSSAMVFDGNWPRITSAPRSGQQAIRCVGR